MRPTSSTGGCITLSNSHYLPIHHAIVFPLRASASTSLSSSRSTTCISRIPVEARVPTERSAIPCGNVRLVFLRDTHPDVDPRSNGGMGRAERDDVIACPRGRHPNVSGITIFPVSTRAGRTMRASSTLLAVVASRGSILCGAENGGIVPYTVCILVCIASCGGFHRRAMLIFAGAPSKTA